MITFLAFLVGLTAGLTFGFVAGGTYECYRLGGSRDLRRDVNVALREYDELLSLLSSPPVRDQRGTPHPVTPVRGVERSPLSVIRGGDSA